MNSIHETIDSIRKLVESEFQNESVVQFFEYEPIGESISVRVPLSCIAADPGRRRRISRQLSQVETSSGRRIRLVTVSYSDCYARISEYIERLLASEFSQQFSLFATGETSKGEVQVFLQPIAAAGKLAAAGSSEVRSRIAGLLAELGVQLVAVHLVSSGVVEPSPIAVLKAVQRLQPVTLEEVSDALSESAFLIPDSKWLANQMDQLRKAGHLIWHSGKFSLTAIGLSGLGGRGHRNSGDIGRALSFRHKRW